MGAGLSVEGDGGPGPLPPKLRASCETWSCADVQGAVERWRAIGDRRKELAATDLPGGTWVLTPAALSGLPTADSPVAGRESQATTQRSAQARTKRRHRRKHSAGQRHAGDEGGSMTKESMSMRSPSSTGRFDAESFDGRSTASHVSGSSSTARPPALLAPKRPQVAAGKDRASGTTVGGRRAVRRRTDASPRVGGDNSHAMLWGVGQGFGGAPPMQDDIASVDTSDSDVEGGSETDGASSSTMTHSWSGRHLDTTPLKNKIEAHFGPTWLERSEWFQVFTPVEHGDSAQSLLELFQCFCRPASSLQEQVGSLTAVDLSARSELDARRTRFAATGSDVAAMCRVARLESARRARGLVRRRSSVLASIEAGLRLQDQTDIADARQMFVVLLLLCQGDLGDRTRLAASLYSERPISILREPFCLFFKCIVRMLCNVRIVSQIPDQNAIDVLAAEMWYSAHRPGDLNMRTLKLDALAGWVAKEVRRGEVPARLTGKPLPSVLAQSVAASEKSNSIGARRAEELAAVLDPRQMSQDEARTDTRRIEQGYVSTHGVAPLIGTMRHDSKMRFMLNARELELARRLALGRAGKSLRQSTHFSQQELLALAHEYVKIVHGAGGAVKRPQWKEFLQRFVPACALLSDRLFDIFDADNSNAMSWREFAASVSPILRGTLQERLRLLYLLAPRDDKGRITVVELVKLVAPFDLNLKTICTFSEKVFRSMDNDNNDGIDVDEFLSGLDADVDLKDQFISFAMLSPELNRQLIKFGRRCGNLTQDSLNLAIDLLLANKRLARPATRSQFKNYLFSTFGSSGKLDKTVDVIFDHLDAGFTGRVSIREALVLFSQFVSENARQHCSNLFRCIDLDGNGELDFNEFVNAMFMLKRSSSPQAAEFVSMLHLMDENANGLVEESELMTRGPRCRLIIDCLDQLFAKSQDLQPVVSERVRKARHKVSNAAKKTKAVTTLLSIGKSAVAALTDGVNKSGSKDGTSVDALAPTTHKLTASAAGTKRCPSPHSTNSENSEDDNWDASSYASAKTTATERIRAEKAKFAEAYATEFWESGSSDDAIEDDSTRRDPRPTLMPRILMSDLGRNMSSRSFLGGLGGPGPGQPSPGLSPVDAHTGHSPLAASSASSKRLAALGDSFRRSEKFLMSPIASARDRPTGTQGGDTRLDQRHAGTLDVQISRPGFTASSRSLTTHGVQGSPLSRRRLITLQKPTLLRDPVNGSVLKDTTVETRKPEVTVSRKRRIVDSLMSSLGSVGHP